MRDEIRFIWDHEKAATNLHKHGVSFLTAAEALAGQTVEWIDDRENYGEERYIALGRVDLSVYRVVYSLPNDGAIRIISAQKADKHERKRYYGELYT